ncbi:MAG: response regulator [Fibrobacterota bacterium]
MKKSNILQLLLVEDNGGDARLIVELLKEIENLQFEIEHVETLKRALTNLENKTFDIVLSDLSLPDSHGLGTFAQLHAKYPNVPIVILTGANDETLASEAVKKGAQDYLDKDHIDSYTLSRAIRYAIERKQLEKQIRHSQKMEAIGTLTGGIAHDFNNLLGIIQGYTELALIKTDRDAPTYPVLKNIQEASSSAIRLTSHLLLIGRRQQMDFVLLNVNDSVCSLTRLLKRMLPIGITIVTNLPGDLWTVQADAGTIEQVLMNLVINAKDAMPQGGTISITTENLNISEDYCRQVSEARPGRFICLSVADNGMGIDGNILPQIFEPFFTTKGVGKGTGLGLSVVYGIIQQHQGWIRVESALGKGTVFKCYLPYVSEGLAGKSLEPFSLQGLSGHGERILLVEDEKSVQDFIAEALESSGYQVIRAGSAEEALDIFTREKGEFHLVYSDVVLPRKSGQTLIEELAALKPGLRLLLTSGHTDMTPSKDFSVKKPVELIRKPVTLSHLLVKVKKALSEKA